MRICILQGIMTLTIIGVSIAHTNEAQILDQQVSLRLENAPMETFFLEVEKQTTVKFVYSPGQIEGLEKITLKARKEELGKILKQVLQPRHIGYTIYEKEGAITLKKLHLEENYTDEADLKRDKSHAKIDTLIQGTISDQNNQPMAGVNIIIKGTAQGTTSGTDGRFILDGKAADVLIFSFIGYQPQEITVGSQTNMEIMMREETQSLDEVIVNAGYWKVREKEQTGNIGKISAEEIAQQPVSNPLQSLSGRMAGVYVQQTSGVPGSSINVKIRGTNSLRSNGNYPLYIIDGVPFNGDPLGSTFSTLVLKGGSPLNLINPADIESIEILKDADATAIYGSRGANGVVLITTKKGKAGRTAFDVNTYQGAGRVSSTMDLLNTQQYLEMRNEAFANDGVVPALFNAPDLVAWDNLRYTDWQKELIGGTANISRVQTTLSGGDNRTQFSWGNGYYRETTVFPGNFSDQKISSHLSLSHESPDRKLKLSQSTSFVFDKNRLLYQDLTNQALTLAPNAPALLDEQGDLNWENNFQNPYSFLRQKFKTDSYNLIANTTLEYQITPNFSLQTRGGYNRVSMNETVLLPINAFNPSYGITTGSASLGDRSVNTWIVEPMGQYIFPLGKGKLTAMLGGTFQHTNRDGTTTYAYGFSADALLENLSAASGSSVIFTQDVKYRYNAIFGRLNYNLAEKYILNLTARRDGSSRFGKDKQFANFGAIGAAWIFTNENFLANNDWLSFGKLRASFGTTGSDQIGDYQYIDSYTATRYPYDGASGLYPTRLANAEYSWEQSKKTETGIEIGLLRDRVNLSMSYYQNLSANQLVGYPLSAVTGFSEVQFNLPAKVKNFGWEGTLESHNIIAENFQWTSAVNISIPKNILLEYPNLEESTYANTYVVGYPLAAEQRLQFLEVDQQTGVYQFLDVNENGSGIDVPGDILPGRALQQSLFGGWSNTLTYRNIKLDIFFQGVKQFGRGHFSGFTTPGKQSNQPITVMERWQNAGDITNVQMFTTGSGPANTAYGRISNYGSNNVVDASFIRLKNVSLSWSLPERWTTKVRLRQARIYVQGQNLFTLTSYPGLDPETQSLTTLPALRIISTGAQITF